MTSKRPRRNPSLTGSGAAWGVRPPLEPHDLRSDVTQARSPAGERSASDQAPASQVREVTLTLDAAAGSRSGAVLGVLAAPAAAALWVGSIVAMVAATRPSGPWRGLEVAQTVGLSLIPAALILLLAFALSQGLKLAREARLARGLSDDLVAPAALAAVQTSGVVETLRAEIAAAAAAAADAARQLEDVRETLALQSRQVAEVAQEAHLGAQAIADRLGVQRREIADLVADLGAQSDAEGATLIERTRLVHAASAAASDALNAADLALSVRTGALQDAVLGAQRVVDAAGVGLDAQTGRLRDTATTLEDTLARFSVGVAGERAQLAALVDALQLEQEEAAALAESRHARLVAQVAQAGAAAAEVDAAAARGAETYRTLAAEAADHLNGLADRGRAAREDLEADIGGGLDRLVAASVERRDALAASTHDSLIMVADARSRIDELGEAAFEAGQRADQAFAARCAAAQRSIETISAAMEEAARRAADRVEKGVESTRDLLQGVEAMLRDVDARYARLPDEARRRTEDARRTIEQGVQALTTAARRAVEDPRALDAPFQERVRRDYARLTEAVRLIGVIADPAAATATAPPPAPALPERVAERAPTPAAKSQPIVLSAEPIALRPQPPPPTRPPAAPEARPDAFAELVEVDLTRATAGRARRFGASTDVESAPAAVASEAAGALRPRLRLTPTRGDEALHALFAPDPSHAPSAPAASASEPTSGVSEAAAFEPLRFGAPPPVPTPGRNVTPGGDGGGPSGSWTWKDLLSTVNEAAETDEDDAAEHLAAEIANLGLDAAALLPPARLVEVERALQASGADGAREAVRRIAPAAVRRLSRRVLTDRLLRDEAARFLRERSEAVAAAAQAGKSALSALYDSETGRTHLLLDAAVGDLD